MKSITNIEINQDQFDNIVKDFRQVSQDDNLQVSLHRYKFFIKGSKEALLRLAYILEKDNTSLNFDYVKTDELSFYSDLFFAQSSFNSENYND